MWLLDEPYANLDRSGIDLVNRLLDHHARRGGAALITSHGAYAFTSGTPRRLALKGEAVLAADCVESQSAPPSDRPRMAGPDAAPGMGTSK